VKKRAAQVGHLSAEEEDFHCLYWLSRFV
jgi:hypothetical protein